ncbi:MAG: NFACT family protein [Anaerolineae bacterium]|nr:NFACT family protein [Anaerolineae bacterium]
MNVDYLTLACLRDHLDSLLGARVQDVVLPDEFSVGLELYAGQRAQLLISADPQHPRMLLAPHKLRRGVETETAPLLLLRKWVRGSRLVDITQPEWERILELHFEGQAGPCRLVAELIGRYSNVILVGPDGNVLDAVRHVGPAKNRYRVILPSRPYQPPPRPVGRQAPTQLPPGEWAALLASTAPDEALPRLLAQRLLGVSPMVAQEITARAADNAPGALGEVTAALFAPLKDGSWSPHVAVDEAGNVVAFAPYEPRQFERIQQASDISAAMWQYFEHRLSGDAYAAARWRVQERIDEMRARTGRTLRQLQENAADANEIESLREAGGLLLTYQGQARPKAAEVTVPDYTGKPRAIKLDPKLTPVENAQAYFRRYRKAVRAAEGLPTRIRAVKADLAYLAQLAADLELAESRPEIDAVYDALVKAGWAPKARPGSGGQVEGPRRLEIDGFPVYMGRNARQNEEVTFKRAEPDDLWLHARGVPGAHVIVKCGNRDVPEEVVQQAASLAAYYSPARDEVQADVDVVQRRHVKKLRGSHPGLVTYRNERTVRVRPKRETDE